MLKALSKAAFDRDVGRIDVRSARMRGWTILEANYPILDVLFDHAAAAPLRLRFRCDDWDEVPPSIELLNREGHHLTTAPPNVGNVFHPGGHPSTGRPFVCMRGAREFHTHPSHTTELWDNYRGQSGMDLGGIVFQLWQAWKRSVG
ncbi:hypothetical protein S58_71780 [Bradyrhizobium oligotrophicum S58]|uniref:Metal binding domain-containing protein n=1 Tax=Bradyrhizobium oligotrophicum S58 TaxID=1245469 RepID=M4ZH33_9BRAD|nr:putative metal-binding protein [Bradyrhizobium oligotrophicum]BAM93142.1 hypothetical protein S58_71780 [Bradyrhizobium oligotrophicum S58]